MALDLNVWTSTTMSNTEWDETAKRWNVTITRNGKERVLHPRHVVVAIGLAGGVPNIPHVPGQVRRLQPGFLADANCVAQDKYKGLAMHSTSFKSGSEYVGKKVLVLGACTSGTFVWR